MHEEPAKVDTCAPINDALLLLDRPVDELYVPSEKGPNSLASRATITSGLFTRRELDAFTELNTRPPQTVASLQHDRLVASALATGTKKLEDIPLSSIKHTAADEWQVKPAHACSYAVDTRR